jgi:hypothetical protein
MPKDVKVTLHFYPGQDDDLIAWMESLHVSYGKKGEALKAVLRQGLGSTTSDKSFLTAGTQIANGLTSGERAIAERAMSETDGKISLKILMGWGMGQGAARHLQDDWKMRGWAVNDPTRKNGLYLTPELADLLIDQNNFLAWVRKSRILMTVSLVEIALLIIAVTTWRENGIATTLLGIIPITLYTALVLISGYREHRQHETKIANRLKGMDNLKKRKVLALMDVAKNSSSEAALDARAVDGK